MPPPAGGARLLRLRLLRGSCLTAGHHGGLGDPYVKFELAGRVLGRSCVLKRCHNPVWDQSFEFDVADCPKGDLLLRVYYRNALRPVDNYAGHCRLPLGALCPDELHTFCMPLSDETGRASEPCLGSVAFTANLQAASQLLQATQRLPSSSAAVAPSAAAAAAAAESAVVATVVLLDGSDLLAARPYVRLRLGGQKFRSRPAPSGRRPCWTEEFRLQLDGEDQRLRLSVCDRRRLATRDARAGRATLMLPTLLPRDAARLLHVPLLDGAGRLRLLVTVSGVCGSAADGGELDDAGTSAEEAAEYSLRNTFSSVGDVGRLTLRLLRVEGLSAARPHCTVQLHNTILRTPEGSCSGAFSFEVKDLHASVEICAFDESRRPVGRPRLLGRAAVRLLRLQRPGSRWYALKDKTLEAGAGARALVECRLTYNPLRAAAAALRRPEQPPRQPAPRFRVAVLRRNVRRLLALAERLADVADFCGSCCSWRDPARSAAALAAAVGFAWNLRPCLLPLAACGIVLSGALLPPPPAGADAGVPADADASGDELEEAEEAAPASLLQRMRAAQDALLTAQEAVGRVAEFGERLRHVADWTEPWLSRMAVALLLCCCAVLLALPLRVVAVAWIVGKFAKRLLLPQAADSNELLNFIARVPSDLDLLYAAAPPTQPEAEAEANVRR